MPDEGVAEDLTAATFEQAFRKIGQLRNDDAFAGWLFRIARNEIGQYYRRRRPRTNEGQSSLDDLLDLPDRRARRLRLPTRREQLTGVLEAIAGLTPREQEIIALRFVGGLTNHEIGQAMNLSDSNAGVILFRAIRKVRDLLGIEAGREP